MLLTGCDADPQSAVGDETEYPAVVRIVEVLGAPGASQPAFVELRNDSEAAADLDGWKLSTGGRSVALKPRIIPGSVNEARGDAVMTIPAHSLALVVDEAVPTEALVELACEAPIATSRDALGPAHAASDAILASTLELQSRRHCIPVFSAESLEANLGSGGTLSLSHASGEVDRAEADFASAPRGVAFERRGIEAREFDLSPLGSTPGMRNFYRSDQEFLYARDRAALPLSALSSSPWRVGDKILELTREAATLEAAGDAAGAEAARAAIQALYDGQLPHNPMVEPFLELLAQSSQRVSGSFFQINESEIVDGFIEAKHRGVDVRLTTDAEFMNHQHYVEGFAKLAEADIPVAFDLKNGTNKAPLSHNKFMTVDGEWVFTGSFNPIHDEPSRIHADNAVLIRSKAAAKLHEQEFETLFGGTFGTDKRKVGVGGGRFNVDGAEVSVRFSPGMTDAVLKRRANELSATGDPAKACDVRLTNNSNAIPDRYRALDPCGGPYDLIVGEVARATSSVYFVSFSLSLEDLGTVALERLAAGVDVKGVVDPTVSTRGIVEQMTEAGADVRYTPNSDPDCPAYVTPRYTCPSNPNKVWLHHKFIVIDYGTDHPVVITGSHNLSTSAESKNDETLLVIRDRAIAESYFRIFRETFNHPQTMGVHRSTEGLPALAITEVKASADASDPQFVEITNVGYDPVSLSGLELWNRRGAPLSLESGDTLAPGQRAVVVVGDAGALAIDSSAPVVTFAAEEGRPLIDPSTALVLRTSDGRWVATYDPYTSEQTLPEGVSPRPAGASSFQWASLHAASLDQMMVELLGVNTTPADDVPTWDPKGFYSDWADEHEVTRTVLVLYNAPLAAWTADLEPTPGR